MGCQKSQGLKDLRMGYGLVVEKTSFRLAFLSKKKLKDMEKLFRGATLFEAMFV